MKTIFGYTIFNKKDMSNFNNYIESINNANRQLKVELSALKRHLGQYVKSEVQNEN